MCRDQRAASGKGDSQRSGKWHTGVLGAQQEPAQGGLWVAGALQWSRLEGALDHGGRGQETRQGLPQEQKCGATT